jgi:hypothetical protein
VGSLKFLRCGRCKKTLYCSQHCQRTHWRDGHKLACTVPTTAVPTTAPLDQLDWPKVTHASILWPNVPIDNP